MEADEQAVVRRLDKALAVFLKENPLITVSALSTFLSLAMKEGVGPTEISKRLGIPLATASRHLLDMSERNRKAEPGLGWVERRSSDKSLAALEYTLSPKGKSLIHEVSNIWR